MFLPARGCDPRSVRCRRQTVGMGPKDRGPRPKPDARARFLCDLKTTFEWRGDRPNPRWAADATGWWADASILRRLGPALAEPFADLQPTLVIGPQSRGTLLGALVAVHLGVGLVELRKYPDPSADSERWLTTRTPPDYQDRNLEIGLRRDLLPSTARALFVDDWIDTGGQAVAARKLVDAAAATWCGASVIVDALEDARLRRALDVKCLFRVNDL
jgi:adenine phosphoribosyltransferase